MKRIIILAFVLLGTANAFGQTHITVGSRTRTNWNFQDEKYGDWSKWEYCSGFFIINDPETTIVFINGEGESTTYFITRYEKKEVENKTTYDYDGISPSGMKYFISFNIKDNEIKVMHYEKRWLILYSITSFNGVQAIK